MFMCVNAFYEVDACDFLVMDALYLTFLMIGII